MFKVAKPITVKELDGVMNSFATFAAQVDSLSGAELHICAADVYRVSVNGVFVASGPARTAKGYARMDRIPLEGHGRKCGNQIIVSVSGHGCRSLSTVLQPMFLWAEVVRNGEILAATGRDFDCYLSGIRNPKTARYSVQRHFVEEWDLRCSLFERSVPVAVIENPPRVIERVAPYPVYTDVPLSCASSMGHFEADPDATVHKNFYSFQPSERWGRYPEDEVRHSYEWVQGQKQLREAGETALPLGVCEGHYAIFEMSRTETGFLHLFGTAEEGTEVVLAFSEDASPDRFAFTDMHVHNVIDLTLGGRFDFLSFEPYTLKYAAVFVKKGDLWLDGFGVRSFAGNTSDVRVPEAITDPVLRGIYEAGIRTFAHNAVDLYTDCPSRERAGWLCDSYFTAKTEYCLHGSTAVEDAFLENYRLYENAGEYPEGVLPMCYPSDAQDDGKFIPQWTMWYILEVGDYVSNRGHGADREKFRKTVYELLAFYARYENSDGLLESLPSWNFVEWSRANGWTQDVSYPTNFLYAEVLRCAERLFGDRAAGEKAERVARETVRQSFDGRLFLDHAVREDGKLRRLSDCSEAGQYYAILFGGIDMTAPDYAELRRLVLEVFGSDRKILLDEIAPINAFIGAYLRLEALLKMGENRAVLDSLAGFFGGMAEETGTLWEYREHHGSRDHGFASYALVAMRQALNL